MHVHRQQGTNLGHINTRAGVPALFSALERATGCAVQADLNTGQVVRQWNCNVNGVNVPMADISADTKHAQLDQRSTFLGLDSNRLCRWDQRTEEGVVQNLPSSLSCKSTKGYSRGTNFTCMATSGDGYIAVGSNDGRIRLYGSKKGMEDYEFKQASTSVPGLGLPITSIDVSFDSRYIVGTTDRYLIVLQTSYKDAKGTNTNGFVSRMGGNTAPPKLLRLKFEDRLKVVCCFHMPHRSLAVAYGLSMHPFEGWLGVP
jgi:WD40 repeat protein